MSDDADEPAAFGEALSPNAHPYVYAHRLDRGARGYVALCSKPGANGSAMEARCYEGAALFAHLPAPGAEGEHFISVNTFKRPRRRIADLLSLRACFLDLDYFRLPAWVDFSEGQIWIEVQARLHDLKIPLPTMVVASGRGLHLYWTFPKALPAGALPSWNAVQRYLYFKLKEFGADQNARDAARIMRLAGTWNPKAGKLATFLHLDLDRDVDFGVIALAVLPLTRWELQERRKSRVAREGRPEKCGGDRSGRARDAHRAFVDAVIADIDCLIDHRWGGQIPEGARNQTLFVRGCFLVRRVGTANIETALLAYGRVTCDLAEDEICQLVGSITKKILEDGRGYRYSTVGAAEALGVTVDEVRAAGLRRLHPADPELEAERRELRRALDRARKARGRRAAGVRSRSEIPKQGTPWLSMGISRSTWYRKYYISNPQT